MGGQGHLWVKDHLIPSSTPAHTPQRGAGAAASRRRAAAADEEEEDLASEGSASASEDSEASDSDDGMRTPPRGRRPVMRRDKRPRSDTEAESEEGEVCVTKEARRVRLAPEVELKAITPPQMEPGEAMRVFFN